MRSAAALDQTAIAAMALHVARCAIHIAQATAHNLRRLDKKNGLQTQLGTTEVTARMFFISS
jgi:hypothetical protein